MEDVEEAVREMTAAEKLEALEAILGDFDDMGQDELVRNVGEYARARHLAMTYEGQTGREEWMEQADEMMDEMRRIIGAPTSDEEG